jgi:hypothetical protein
MLSSVATRCEIVRRFVALLRRLNIKSADPTDTASPSRVILVGDENAPPVNPKLIPAP